RNRIPKNVKNMSISCGFANFYSKVFDSKRWGPTLSRFKYTHLNVQSSGNGHIDQCIKTKNIDFSTHEVRDAGLGHAKKLGGLGLAHLDADYVLLQRCHEG